MQSKRFTLPSGMPVEIRRPGPLSQLRAYGKLTKLSVPDSAQGPLPVAWSDGLNLADAMEPQISLLCLCSVSPRFSAEWPAPEGTTSLDDLSVDDFNALMKEFGSFQRSEADEIAPLSETATAS